MVETTLALSNKVSNRLSDMILWLSKNLEIAFIGTTEPGTTIIGWKNEPTEKQLSGLKKVVKQCKKPAKMIAPICTRTGVYCECGTKLQTGEEYCPVCKNHIIW